MAVLPVRTFPDALLKSPSHPVGRVTPAVGRLIDDLVETMRKHPRCVGLAACQAGSSARVAVIDVTGHPKAKRASGLVVLVDPAIVGWEGVSVQREGCLSVPDLTGNVRRAVRVQVEALDRDGAPFTKWFDGFEAIAVQHEVDHLDGKLFLDRIANIRTDLFRRKQY